MKPEFQFSLGKMLRATAWFAVICVAVAGLHRTQDDDLLRDVYRTRMIAYAVLGILGAILAASTLMGAERAGCLLAFWILMLLAATLAFFVIVHDSHRRLRLTMPEAVSLKRVPASTPSPSASQRVPPALGATLSRPCSVLPPLKTEGAGNPNSRPLAFAGGIPHSPPPAPSPRRGGLGRGDGGGF
jgi:hypothetical protein